MIYYACALEITLVITLIYILLMLEMWSLQALSPSKNWGSSKQPLEFLSKTFKKQLPRCIKFLLYWDSFDR